MNLPEEIRNKAFGLSFRGYNVDEVEDYIEDLLERYDAVYSENAELTERGKKLMAALEAAKKEAPATPGTEEQTGAKDAQELLSRVQAGARELIAKAQAEAKLIKEKAAGEARRVLVSAKEESSRAAAEINALKETLLLEKAQRTNGAGDGQGEEISAKTQALRDEYEVLKKEVEAFRTNLFKLYCDHIQALSDIEIPASPQPREIKRKEPVAVPAEAVEYGEPEEESAADFSELLDSNEEPGEKEDADSDYSDLAGAIRLENEKSEPENAAPKYEKRQSFKDVKTRLNKAGASDKK